MELGKKMQYLLFGATLTWENASKAAAQAGNWSRENEERSPRMYAGRKTSLKKRRCKQQPAPFRLPKAVITLHVSAGQSMT